MSRRRSVHKVIRKRVGKCNRNLCEASKLNRIECQMECAERMLAISRLNT